MIRNREGESEYDVHWAWEDGSLEPGLTCVFRVKNEARNLPWVLPPMFRAVQRVVLVDNGSDDGTAEVARTVAEQCGAADRYLGTSYPFSVARAGEEHRATPADSVHSLTHFYNWSFSHVRTAYSMKWDGDMVLTPEGERILGDLSWQLENSETVVVVPRHPVTIVDERTAWIDLSRKFNEPWVYPMGPDYTFVKAFDWEVREWPETAERLELPEGLAIELKWLDADEFSHWTDPATFDRGRSPRKVREWQVDQAIREGRAESVDGLVKITAPAGTHVIEHVLHTWLPEQKRPLVRPRAASAPAPAPVAPASPQPKPKRGNDILFQELDRANKPALVLLHEDLGHVRDRIPDGVDVVDLPVAELPTDNERYRSIFLAVPDRDALQRAVAVLPATRATKTVGVWVQWLDGAFTLQPREEWGPMLSQQSRRNDDEFVLWARMRQWNPGRQMLAELARQAVADGLSPHAGVRVAVHGGALAPPGETEALRLASLAEGSADDVDVPPDVIVTHTSASSSPAALPEHHVTGRAPVVVADTSGPLAIGALDERILNPRGFLTHAPEADAVLLAAGDRIVLRHAGGEVSVPAHRGATEQMVHELRTTRAVRPAWPTADSLGFARAVAGLAMAGVPLTTESAPAWARGYLGDTVADLVSTSVDLDDGLRREEHSVRLRRAALGEFSKAAWRRRVTAGTTLRPPASDTVSIVLATKREANLEHAMRQVARQRGADVELVLCPHGWDVDPGRVRDLVGDLPVQVLPHPADVLFGDVLAAGVEAASGNIVLKLDDDDWYGPDVVSDLLLARSYTGAELVGMPAEMLYLVPLDETVRRTDPSETAGKFVAGGTMMIERDVLRSLGSFRSVRRYVDASLLADLLGAGGTVYRTQGLGYLFRRSDSGHTWEADIDYFLDPERLEGRWKGFRPSALLELDAPD